MKPLRVRTKLLRALVITALVLVAALMCARLYGAYRWNAETRELQSRLDAARTPVRPQTVDFHELEGLPTPNRLWRYPQLAFANQRPLTLLTAREHGSNPG